MTSGRTVCRRPFTARVLACAAAVGLGGVGLGAVAGCSGSNADTTTTVPATSAAPGRTSSTVQPTTSRTSTATTTTPQGPVRTVVVTGRKISPPPETVDLRVGQTLTLTLTVNHDDRLHAHGFDVEEKVTAGRPLTVALTAEQPGVYEVELHDPELRLFEVAIR
ncbi:MAG TPA: hypothetical protein VFJ97_06130 [Dermatophilaceae bacterium]|nr:hypothetical protein [Dermatophilaceae bacterium]